MDKDGTELILTGGGARAAYQAGVLLAIRDLLPDARRSPFSILCGTSAGAINALALACNAGNFPGAVQTLADLWGNISADQVYRVNPLAIAGSGVRWLGALLFGGLFQPAPRSLLDNEPLRRMLARWLKFRHIERALASGALRAVSVTASGYTSGESVSFFQARDDVEAWQRTHRMGSRARLNIDHVMASTAIPLIFPAVYLNREFFGDGSMRQLAPISPAIHLGAKKILVIGAGRLAERTERQHSPAYPTPAQIAGHVLSSIFLDTLAVDIERMQRINRTLGTLPMAQRQHLPLRPIAALIISPSQRLDYLAARHVHALPRSLGWLLRGIGAMNRRGGALASYLLFEREYTQALIDLGRKDTMARAAQVRAFLGS
jgi:NTE family protein